MATILTWTTATVEWQPCPNADIMNCTRTHGTHTHTHTHTHTPTQAQWTVNKENTPHIKNCAYKKCMA